MITVLNLALALLVQISASQKTQVLTAAKRLMPGVTWKEESVILADFTCRGRTEQAILGTVSPQASNPYAILAVFLDGLDKQPELVRDSAHVPARVLLTLENLDYPEQEIESLQGFEPSATCKGLNLGDNEAASFHLYWNHALKQFSWWRR
jgi:hypothetical protein